MSFSTTSGCVTTWQVVKQGDQQWLGGPQKEREATEDSQLSHTLYISRERMLGGGEGEKKDINFTDDRRTMDTQREKGR